MDSGYFLYGERAAEAREWGLRMKGMPDKKRREFSLLFSIILIFSVFGGIVFSVSQKISREMSAAAIQNLSESLDLIQSTIEAILRSEAEFQLLIAQEIARAEDPEAYIRGKHKDHDLKLEREELADGTILYHVNASGILQRYTFTEI